MSPSRGLDGYTSNAPPFDTYIYIVYINDNDQIIAYSDRHIAYNNVDDLLEKVSYPIHINQLPKLNSDLYEVENLTASKVGSSSVQRLYHLRHSYTKLDLLEQDQQRYGQFSFNIVINTENKFDKDFIIDKFNLINLRAELTPYKYGKNSDFEVWMLTEMISRDERYKSLTLQSIYYHPINYQYRIILDFNYKPIAYVEFELPKKEYKE